MDKIKKEVNDCNKEVVKELTNLYNKLSDSIDKSYYYGQKSGYEEILAWFKQSQNKSVKYISPKKINNYLIEKGAKSKLLLNNKSNNNYNHKEDIKRRTNKANFNYLFYNQTFNFDNNKSNNELNIFPTSVENAFNNNRGNIINPIFFDNNNSLLQQNNHIALLTNPSLNNNLNNYNNNNDKDNCFIRNNLFDNNNINESEDEQMKPNSPLRTNIIQGNLNLKRKKNS